MRFKNLILALAITAMLAFTAFASAQPSPADQPAFERSRATLNVSTIDTTETPFVVVDRTAAFAEVNVSPPEIGVASIDEDSAYRTATAICSNQFSTSNGTGTSPPRLSADSLDTTSNQERTDERYVPLGSPKPVEATARNGSPAASRRINPPLFHRLPRDA